MYERTEKGKKRKHELKIIKVRNKSSVKKLLKERVKERKNVRTKVRDDK